MIDRIEELLGSLAAEDDEEEEREDVLTLPVTEETVPSSPRENEGEDGDGGEDGDSGTEDKSGGLAAGEITLEQSEPIAGELWKNGPVWTVHSRSPKMDSVQKIAAEEWAAQTEETLQPPRGGDLALAGLERTARDGMAGLMLERTGRSGAAQVGLEQAGLKGLYRQTVQGLRPAAPTLPPEQAGRTARAQEPGSAASLAVDELDRAVRRDSRRYDGGMSIY